MTTGTIKWFDTAMGFGFITPDDGGADIFLHSSKLDDSKIAKLEAGHVVSYQIGIKADKRFAYDLVLISSEPLERPAKLAEQRPLHRQRPMDAVEQFEQEWGLRRV